MRAHEFLTESRVINEILMNNSEWAKTEIDKKTKKETLKYLTPFLQAAEDQSIFSFGYTKSIKDTKTGKPKQVVDKDKNFEGIIDNPLDLIRQVKSTFKTGAKLSSIRFSAKVVDEDGNFTDEVVDNLTLSNVWKDYKITGSLKVNMGNVSEIILGCAVATKFEKQGAAISEKELIDTAVRLAENKGEMTSTAGKDQLYFKVTVPFADKKAFFAYVGKDSREKTLQDYKVSEETINLIGQRIKSAVSYANTSKRIVSAINEAKNDPAKNKVDVISDGGEKENQTTTKVDLKILIDGNEVGKRLLSVKAGNVGQFGQVGGHNFDKADLFFSTTLGINLSPSVQTKFLDVPTARGYQEEKYKNYIVGFKAAYTDAVKQANRMAKSAPDDFLENVFKGLKYHLTLNEPGVEMVILEPSTKKAFSELSFGDEFEKAVRQLVLYVDFNETEKGYYMSIYGQPKTQLGKKFIPKSGNLLIKLLTSITKEYNVRNRINMGPLLKHLADIENYIEKIEAQPQQQKQPAAKTPAPVQGVKPAGVKPIVKTPTTKPLPNVGQPMGKQSTTGQRPIGQPPTYSSQ
jgi:hypothetical protein